MASTGKMGLAELRGHQYVTGFASPQMEKPSTHWGVESAERASSLVATAAEGIVSRLMHTVRRRPAASLLLGLSVGLVILAFSRGKLRS